VTGCAGFIGSNLTDRLLRAGHAVVGYDDFSTGRLEFLSDAGRNASFTLVRGDLLDMPTLINAMQGADVVFHIAANADVRFGTHHPRKDLEQNTLVTSNVLEAMRVNRIHRIAFASTGSVYGESSVIPTPEDSPFPIQTSLYGASKLACEGLIEAYCEGFEIYGYIFRFVSILGERYTHGHIVDFYRQLRESPGRLCVLGNGKQKKSYLHVQDCIDAMLLALEKANRKVNIFNLGTDEYCTVDDSIGWICQHLGVNPKLEYAGGDRGWIGDNPFILLDCRRIRSLGWTSKMTIKNSVENTLQYLQQSEPAQSK